MSNIFDYLEWRGDLSIKVDKFNEIDNLILSRLSYFPFDGLFESNEEIELKEVYERYKKLGTTGRILQKEDIDLFPLLAKSNRFGDLKLTRYTNKLDLIKEKQFSAITILLPDEIIYVSYRGTDNTVVGWKKDFNMSFSELVPSQTDAVEYLENVAKAYNKKLLVGGYSKGGNLAVYVGTFCKKEIQNNIIKIYNNDGSGFVDKVLNTTHIETWSEFSNNKFTNAITILKTYKNIDDKSKEIMIKTLKAFFSIARNNITFGKPKIKNLNKIINIGEINKWIKK